MENREATAITAASAPYLTGLANAYGFAGDYYGVGHPSEPNYIAAVAGSPLGVTSDGAYQLADPSLFDQLTKAGLSWRVYAQDYPGGCFTGTSAAGGLDGPGAAGTYVRKHNPAISFTSISGNPTACAWIQPLRRFDPTAASFELVVPNLTNDMHDGSTAQGDAFLRAFVPSILASPDWARTVLVITFDEGATNAGQLGDHGGRVFTVVVRAGLSHVVSRRYYDHYSLLRTTEDAFGLPYLGAAATRSPMSDLIP